MQRDDWSNRLFVAAKDLQLGLRQLRRSPVTSATLLITLALGIAGTTAMFSLVNAWLLRPLPLKNPEQLVSVWRTSRQAPREPAFFNLYHDIWCGQAITGHFNRWRPRSSKIMR